MVLVFKSFFLDWLYFFFDFGFWLSVRNCLYFVFDFGFLYWLIAWHPPFYLAPYFYIGLPHLFDLTDQIYFILFLSSIRSSASAAAPTASSRPR
jgi:hypothetical protein